MKKKKRFRRSQKWRDALNHQMHEVYGGIPPWKEQQIIIEERLKTGVWKEYDEKVIPKSRLF